MKQLQRYTKKLNLSIGLLVIVGFLVVMLVSFFYTPHDVNAMNIPEKLRGPGGAYLLGQMNSGVIFLAEL